MFGKDWAFSSTEHAADNALPVCLLDLLFTAIKPRLEDEAVRTAVALRLAVNLCVPHASHCGAHADVFGV